jgi:hypothetical protein
MHAVSRLNAIADQITRSRMRIGPRARWCRPRRTGPQEPLVALTVGRRATRAVVHASLRAGSTLTRRSNRWSRRARPVKAMIGRVQGPVDLPCPRDSCGRAGRHVPRVGIRRSAATTRWSLANTPSTGCERTRPQAAASRVGPHGDAADERLSMPRPRSCGQVLSDDRVVRGERMPRLAWSSFVQSDTRPVQNGHTSSDGPNQERPSGTSTPGRRAGPTAVARPTG